MSKNAAGEAEVHDPGLRAVGGRMARSEARTDFGGVCWRPGGELAARMRESNGQSQAWLGTFDTAEHAARAFVAAAVKRHGAVARTNFKQAAAIDDGGVSSLLHVQGEPSGGQEAGTQFRGVCKLPGGKFGARIRDSKSKGKSQKWIGTFDTADDAARAFDAAAVKIRGAAAITNFRQPAAIDDGGVSSLLHVPAEPSGHDVRTKFRGVSGQPGGKFSAKIRDYKGNSQRWLGTFDTAEDAARAFDAAAVKIRGPAAITNFNQPAAIDEGGVSSLVHCKPIAHPAKPSGSHDAGTQFRGVTPQKGGKFGARIRVGKSQKWLGTFDTAEDAARAFDAAAVMIRGPAAITNFKQPAASDDGGVSSLGHCKSIAQIWDRKGKAVPSLGGFDSPGMRHDDLPVDLSPAEWRHVDDLLKDMDSRDDREALMEGAAILQHISLADMEIMGQNWPLLQ